jgi:hypothetical protein
MLKCPNCKSENINQYRMPTGKIWCTDCNFTVDNKEVYNPFICNDTPSPLSPEEQERIYNEWNKECDRLKNLSACIQNYYPKMIADNYITKEEIKKSVVDFRSSYVESVKKLHKLTIDLEDLTYNPRNPLPLGGG